MFNKSEINFKSIATILFDTMLDQGNATMITANDWHILANLSLIFSESFGLILMIFGLCLMIYCVLNNNTFKLF